MSKNNNSSSGGLDFCSVLTLIFITLKLTNYITWSWWWVLSPLWITFGIVVVAVILAVMFGTKTKVNGDTIYRYKNK